MLRKLLLERSVKDIIFSVTVKYKYDGGYDFYGYSRDKNYGDIDPKIVEQYYIYDLYTAADGQSTLFSIKDETGNYFTGAKSVTIERIDTGQRLELTELKSNAMYMKENDMIFKSSDVGKIILVKITLNF